MGCLGNQECSSREPGFGFQSGECTQGGQPLALSITGLWHVWVSVLGLVSWAGPLPVPPTELGRR